MENAFDDLDAPVRRVGSLDAPAIYSPAVEPLQLPPPRNGLSRRCSRFADRGLNPQNRMPIITMPKLSDTMVEGTIARWKKKQGDTVETGDILAEVETDKATMEMEAFDDGVHRGLVPDGGVAKVGEKIALVLAEGESPDGADAAPAAKEEAASAAQPAESSRSAIRSAGAYGAERSACQGFATREENRRGAWCRSRRDPRFRPRRAHCCQGHF